ncbi:hypothetical protein KEM48_011888 [Puccinia striiformis f. sp. tritici PST-130]|nr:hypothetical protein KEM48_011888 [Puccinia striiformis f. sp. tritici PST-130]
MKADDIRRSSSGSHPWENCDTTRVARFVYKLVFYAKLNRTFFGTSPLIDGHYDPRLLAEVNVNEMQRCQGSRFHMLANEESSVYLRTSRFGPARPRISAHQSTNPVVGIQAVSVGFGKRGPSRGGAFDFKSSPASGLRRWEAEPQRGRITEYDVAHHITILHYVILGGKFCTIAIAQTHNEHWKRLE